MAKKNQSKKPIPKKEEMKGSEKDFTEGDYGDTFPVKKEVESLIIYGILALILVSIIGGWVYKLQTTEIVSVTLAKPEQVSIAHATANLIDGYAKKIAKPAIVEPTIDQKSKVIEEVVVTAPTDNPFAKQHIKNVAGSPTCVILAPEYSIELERSAVIHRCDYEVVESLRACAFSSKLGGLILFNCDKLGY